ncbi:MAG TPA: formate dehydrogenase accessory protein FdhE [Candidatus Acidoferrum sp.]|jgi:FdhE protein
MTREHWLTRHPYLQPVADLQIQVEATAAVVPIPDLAILQWDDYVSEFLNGVPLLQSAGAAIDLQPAEVVITCLIHELASRTLHGPPAEQIATLAVELQGEQIAPRRVLEWLIHENEFTPSYPGLLRYLGWTALRRFLRPVVEVFAEWRDEERWLRRYCPTCGSLPAMAQLVGMDSGRIRLLSCGCCGTFWRYRRIGCTFCENEDDRRISVLTCEGENGLRIDYCDLCGGYLKAYEGRGFEPFLLEDWTSLHLDIIARDRGLKRLASSLYEL